MNKLLAVSSIALVLALCRCGPSAGCQVLLSEVQQYLGTPPRCPFNHVLTGVLDDHTIECAEISVTCPVK